MSRKRLVPDQVGRKWVHQAKSALASRVRVTWWWRGTTVVLRSMSRRRKILPGGTTLQANASLPMSESRRRFVHVRFPRRSKMALRISVFRSAVMEACMEVVSRRMPRNVREVEGPSSFSTFVGAFMDLQTSFILAMFWEHIGDPAGPAVKKSSR